MRLVNIKLALKKEYEGVTIMRSNIQVGKVIFNASKVESSKYINYYNLGFEELFEIVEEPIEVLEPTIKPVAKPIEDKPKTKRKPTKK
jgi:hypothetical protein